LIRRKQKSGCRRGASGAKKNRAQILGGEKIFRMTWGRPLGGIGHMVDFQGETAEGLKSQAGKARSKEAPDKQP
jgi:hypothetical protein